MEKRLMSRPRKDDGKQRKKITLTPALDKVQANQRDSGDQT